jgi:hypothetical protein
VHLIFEPAFSVSNLLDQAEQSSPKGRSGTQNARGLDGADEQTLALPPVQIGSGTHWEVEYQIVQTLRHDALAGE